MLPISKITHLLSQAQLAALGEVAANSAELEWMLGFILMWCLRLNGTETRAIIGDAMLHRRITLLEVVGNENIPDQALKDKFKVIIEKMKELSVNRNTVIHGTWGAKGAHVSFEDSIDMEFGNKTPESIFADNPKNAKKYSAEELRQLADDLDSVRNDLWNFSKEQWWRRWTDEVFLKHGLNALIGLRKE